MSNQPVAVKDGTDPLVYAIGILVMRASPDIRTIRIVFGETSTGVGELPGKLPILFQHPTT